GLGAAGRHPLRPDPVPRVRRLGPARDRGRQGQAAGHPAGQVEDGAADGRPGGAAAGARSAVGRLRPAVRVAAALPDLRLSTALAGDDRHPLDRLAVLLEGAAEDAAALSGWWLVTSGSSAAAVGDVTAAHTTNH